MYFTIYTQKWSNGKTSYHRSAADIPEFAANQTPRPTRSGDYVVEHKADDTVIRVLEGKLGVWY